MNFYEVNLKYDNHIYKELFVAAKNEEEASIRAKGYIATNPENLTPVMVKKVTEKEILSASPRTGKGMVFPHKNGKDYPVILPKHVKLADIEEENNQVWIRIPGTEGISDCNGNVYAYFYSESTGLLKSFYVADYMDYIEDLRKSIGE